MLRKVTLTGLLMFVSKGSMLQLVVGIIMCLAFLFASAWCQPFTLPLANAFKGATEICLVITLSLCVMAKVDLSVEDVVSTAISGSGLLRYLSMMSTHSTYK
jgi:hypothetical protein